jgi:phosphoribosylamine--glycine ligase
MNLAVIGSGGREHAICYKLKQSSKTKKLICIPGNAGTQQVAVNIKEDISNFEALYKIIKKEKIDLVIIGPEQPLVD